MLACPSLYVSSGDIALAGMPKSEFVIYMSCPLRETPTAFSNFPYPFQPSFAPATLESAVLAKISQWTCLISPKTALQKLLQLPHLLESGDDQHCHAKHAGKERSNVIALILANNAKSQGIPYALTQTVLLPDVT